MGSEAPTEKFAFVGSMPHVEYRTPVVAVVKRYGTRPDASGVDDAMNLCTHNAQRYRQGVDTVAVPIVDAAYEKVGDFIGGDLQQESFQLDGVAQCRR